AATMTRCATPSRPTSPVKGSKGLCPIRANLRLARSRRGLILDRDATFSIPPVRHLASDHRGYCPYGRPRGYGASVQGFAAQAEDQERRGPAPSGLDVGSRRAIAA